MDHQQQSILEQMSQHCTMKQLASYTQETKLHCQFMCEESVEAERRSLEDTEPLSAESVHALDEQCNKLCTQKFMRAYLFMHKFQHAQVIERK